nr:DUF5342 family protein [Lysinibacillus timonensis]
MITHFRYKHLYENVQLPGWSVSFYYKQQYFQAEYKKDGKIVWIGEVPTETDKIEQQIHELMLFHIYN